MVSLEAAATAVLSVCAIDETVQISSLMILFCICICIYVFLLVFVFVFVFVFAFVFVFVFLQKWRYLWNQEWYHGTAGVKTTGIFF